MIRCLESPSLFPYTHTIQTLSPYTCAIQPLSPKHSPYNHYLPTHAPYNHYLPIHVPYNHCFPTYAPCNHCLPIYAPYNHCFPRYTLHKRFMCVSLLSLLVCLLPCFDHISLSVRLIPSNILSKIKLIPACLGLIYLTTGWS